VNRWEHCRHEGFRQGCLMADGGGVVNVGNVEALSIVSAAFLYVLEGGKRRRRDNVEAMEVILACQQAGARISYARNEALEQLSQSGLWLDGLNLSQAQLQEIQVPHARWRSMNLQKADLQGACLQDADLQGSDLRDANLRGADLSHADLSGCDLRGCNLQEANLDGARLAGAQLDGAHLDRAQQPDRDAQVADRNPEPPRPPQL
jgi:uncharacterized protein YjbI with pentapeptide repeats